MITTNTATTTKNSYGYKQETHKMAKIIIVLLIWMFSLSLPNDPSIESDGAQKSSEQETSIEERSLIKTFRTQEGSRLILYAG